jgi:hypothetical protein
MEPETPVDWLRNGQALEARNTAESVAGAVRSYEKAVALLRALPVEQVRRELAIAWMNFGNARQKQMDATAHPDAVRAYDDAIALLSAINAPEDFALRNSIGAAWMNRGHALHRQGNAAAIAAALESHDHAIAQLQSLPLGENRSFLINLAAAWMNRAHALLSFEFPDSVAAHEAALKTIQLTSDGMHTDPVIADVSLRARHALCGALSQQLSKKATAELIAETGDIVDESLALVRHWEKQGEQHFRPLALAIFRFGTQFYHAYQPQFLAEFILECVDPKGLTGALFESDELRAIALSTLARARADVYNRSMFDPANRKLQDLRQDLEEAEKRLTEVQSQNHPPSKSGTIS